GAGVSPGDPLGELLPGDLPGLQQRAVTVVDVLQHPVDDVSAELLVIGVGQLVVDHSRQYAPCPSQFLQLVQFLQPQDRRFLDQDVLAGGEGGAGGGEVAVVGRGD